MSNLEVKKLFQNLESLFPEAQCELNYHNLYELTVSVILSAQTTDKSVNKITPRLFAKYPTIYELASAQINEVIEIIKPLGLANNKAKNLISFAMMIRDKYEGVIPNKFENLLELPGIGRKTANVVLSEWFHQNRIAVDTHVERVSKRLGLVSTNASVIQTEYELMDVVDEEYLHKAHHLLIYFGRYLCKAQNPLCSECPFVVRCQKEKIIK